MKNKIHKLHLLLSISTLVFNLHSSNASEFPTEGFFRTESDSGYKGQAYENIVFELETVAKTFPAFAEFHNYGKTVDGKPLTLIKIAIKTNLSGTAEPIKKAVLITGATHGDEFLGIEDKLPRAFLNRLKVLPSLSKFLIDGGSIYIVPVFNPDGYTRRQRENKNGKDLNRDYPVIKLKHPGFTQPETTALTNYLEKDLLDSNHKMIFSMDYHCCEGAFVHPWSFTKTPMLDADLKNHRDFGKFMQGYLGSKYTYGSTYEVLGYLGHGTSKDYYFDSQGATAFTFEGVYASEYKNFEVHVLMWEGLFSELNLR